jgi:hypothetical protein
MNSKYPLFILERNRIILGYDRSYAKQLAEFKAKLYVRVSFKAATPESFTMRIGAIGESDELPFNALKFLLNEGIYTKAAAMTDPSVMPKDERRILISRLDEIDPTADYSATMEEEQIDEEDTTIRRLKAFVESEFAEEVERQIMDGATEGFGDEGGSPLEMENGMSHTNLTLSLLPDTFAICKLEPETDIPPWALAGDFYSITRTKEELSLVCSEKFVPVGVQCEKGWRCILVSGPLNFSLTGILASLTNSLAEAGISVFAISTFDTDYFLVKADNLKRAVLKLEEAGHRIAY